jgi:hypothetical protein
MQTCINKHRLSHLKWMILYWDVKLPRCVCVWVIWQDLLSDRCVILKVLLRSSVVTCFMRGGAQIHAMCMICTQCMGQEGLKIQWENQENFYVLILPHIKCTMLGAWYYSNSIVNYFLFLKNKSPTYFNNHQISKCITCFMRGGAQIHAMCMIW